MEYRSVRFVRDLKHLDVVKRLRYIECESKKKGNPDLMFKSQKNENKDHKTNDREW